MSDVQNIKACVDILSKEKKFRLININPGFTNEFGHHLLMNKNLMQIVNQYSGDYLALANVNLSSEYAESVNAVPVFSNNTWMLSTKGDSYEYNYSFSRELLSALDLVYQFDEQTPNVIFMYLADIRHIPIFLDVARSLAKPNLFFKINLFHAYHDLFSKGTEIEDPSPDILQYITATHDLREQYNISLCVETETLRDAVEKYCGIRLPVLPYVFSTYSINVPEIQSLAINPGDPFIITLPSVSVDRGIEQFASFIEVIEEKLPAHGFEFVVRNQNTENKTVGKRLERIKKFICLKEGIMTGDEYHNLITHSHVMLVPYRVEDFHARTSGVFVDALLCGIPVVAVKNTWAGDFVDNNGNGVSFHENDPFSLLESITRIRQDYKEFLEKAQNARNSWLKTNNPGSFYSFIINSEIENTSSKMKDQDKQNNRTLNLLNTIQYKNARIHELETGNSQIEKKLRLSRKENDRLNDRLTIANDQLKNGKAQRDQMKAELDVLNDKHKDLRDKHNRIKVQYEDLTDQLNTVKKQFKEARVPELREKNKQLSDLLEQTSGKLLIVQKQLDEANEKNKMHELAQHDLIKMLEEKLGRKRRYRNFLSELKKRICIE